MFAFLFKIVLATGLFALSRWITSFLNKTTSNRKGDAEEDEGWWFGYGGIAKTATKVIAVLVLMWAFLGTSMIWVKPNSIATLKRVYFGRSLPPGRIVALDGELGPQARIFTTGFHFELFITLFNEVDQVPVFSVPNNKCAIMSATDGTPPQGGSAFAEPWTDVNKSAMANDATFFLTTGKGQRGPQTTVLTPGSYTINPFLWETPELIDATRIEQGTVGVVKSSVLASVDFGLFKRLSPTNNTLRILTSEKLAKGAAGALLVPVGGIGVWEEPLPNGLYYINTTAYKVTMVPTVAQVYEYKGGYKRRTIQLKVNDKGQITEEVAEVDIQPVPNTADTAISSQPEGWTVWQELRVIAQVSPEMAPFVVASLGLTQVNSSQVVEDRVVTPIIRSIIRDVVGGAQIPIRQQKAVLDAAGMPVLNAAGEPTTQIANEFRSVKVLDLVENRPSLEEAMELRAKPESLKEGVTIMEIRLAESAIPPELLIARKREQLAQQLMKAWKQEELAQGQRQLTENARAQAEQQSELVSAEISAKAAKERAKARETEGEGEKAYLLALAAGQKAQSEILGTETTARLQVFQLALKAVEGVIKSNPELIAAGLQNSSKFVPTVYVGGGSNGGGMEGAAAVFGHLLNPGAGSTNIPKPTVVTSSYKK